jgi:tripartite-type tricarboxylate transporter receptor subunit TctC
MLRSAAIAFLALLATAASAQDWPARPVRFIMPFDAGSSADIAARAIADRLSAQWRQPVVLENKPGAGTIIGTDAVAKAPADGYTFGWVVTAHAINPSLRAKLPYDTLADFAGVTLLYQLKAVIVVSPEIPVSTVPELVRWVKARPGKVSFTSTGTGTGPHLLGEFFRLRHDLDMQHVAYKNIAQANVDVMTGRVPVMFSTLPTMLPLTAAGKVKLLAVVSDQPVQGRAELPILADLLPRDASVGWNGIVVPAKTPRERVQKLNADFAEAARSREVQAVFAKLNVQAMTSSPEAFDAFIRADIARWADVIKRAKVTLEAGG